MMQKIINSCANYICHRLARHLLGLILISTGIGKALDMPGFESVVATYQLMPPWGNTLTAYSLPFIEIATGIGLFRHYRLKIAAYSAVILHGLFLSSAAFTLWRGIALDNCGCFGVFFARPLGAQTLFEDAFLLLVSFSILFESYQKTDQLKN